MNNIQRWFLEQQRRKQNAVSLYSSILTHHFYPYIFYRLRFFGLNTILMSLCYAIECYFLFFYIGRTNAINIIGLRFITVTIYSLWWCVTEILRTRIRHYYRRRAINLIRQEISHWLMLGLCFSIAVLIILVFLFKNIIHKINIQQSYFIEIYLFVTLIHISVSLFVNVLHSSFYALQRISRPFLSIIIAQFIGLCSIVITYSWLKMYALSCAYLIETLIGAGISLYYIFRMNRLINISPKKISGLAQFPHFLLNLYHNGILTSIAVGIAFSSQILLIYFILYHSNIPYTYHLVIVLFLISPQLHQVFSWPMLFYFDFKRLESPQLANIKKRLIHAVNNSALIITLGIWLISVYFLQLFFPERWMIISLLLLPFYTLRSYYGLKYVELFCDYRYLNIIFSTIIASVIVFLLLIFLPHSYSFCLLSIGLLIFIGYVTSSSIYLPKSVPPEIKNIYSLPFYQFFSDAIKKTSPTRILVFTYQHKISSQCKQSLQTKLADSGKITFLDKNTMIFIPYIAEDNHYFFQSSGLVSLTYDSGIQPSGREAIKVLLTYLRQSFLTVHTDIADLAQQKFLINGIIIELNDKKPTDLTPLAESEHSKIFSSAVYFSEIPLSYMKQARHQVVATVNDEYLLEKIYVIPTEQITRDEYINWRNLLLNNEINQLMEKMHVKT